MADVSQIRLPNGDTFDLIDEKSGYITAQYIENKTDYSIPVSRVGEIVVGETAIGTDSTNFPTSKAVVDYVDERVVQEIDAIDVGVISVNGKTGSVTLSASDVGAITRSDLNNELNNYDSYIHNEIPTSTSQLTNDSGFITSYTETDPTVPAWAKASTKPTYTASEVGAAPTGHTHTSINSSNSMGDGMVSTSINSVQISASTSGGSVINTMKITGTATTIHKVVTPTEDGDAVNKKYVDDLIPQVYSSTNTGGYLTMATLPIYDGTVV